MQPPTQWTFLFTDLVASTQLWEEHPEAMDAALARHDLLLRELMLRHGGRIFNTVGDSFHVAFYRPGDALLAAAEAQAALIAEPWGQLGSLDARMALHLGPAVQRDDGFFGPTLNRCSRLLAAGHGRQVLLSAAVVEAVGKAPPPDMQWLDLGLQHLRDLRVPERVYQLLHPQLPVDFPPLLSRDATLGNLPASLTSFVGRERQMAELELLLAGSRLVSLTGPGGCGKTRLALELAAAVTAQYRDGVWLTEFEGLVDPALVPQAVANALGLRMTSRLRPRQGSGDALSRAAADAWSERLVDTLASKQLLLVLDNCEHLVQAVARLSQTLLQLCPDLRILATSREALGLAGEAVLSVPPLGTPADSEQPSLEELARSESVRLFVDRAQQAQPQFALNPENAADVAQICRRLDGIPLALELAAARVRLLTPRQIAERLDDRFRLLTGGSRTSVARQQTLRATMDWSFDLLSPPERALLRRLAVFQRGFSLEAAEAVCGDPGEVDDVVQDQSVMDLLGQLLDKSLVAVEEFSDRYELLETVREYGLERLVESGEVQVYRDRHADWYVRLAQAAAAEYRGPDQAQWLERLNQVHRDLRAALAWSLDAPDAVRAVGLAAHLWWFWYLRGFLAEGRGWLERALALPADPTAPALRAEALLGAGALAWRQRDYAAAGGYMNLALAAFDGLGAERGVARTRRYLGRLAQFQGDYSAAMEAFQDSLARFEALGDEAGVARTLDAMGLAAWQQGLLDQATEWLERSLVLSRRLGDLHGIADALNILGRVAHDRGRLEEAIALYEDSLEVFRLLGDEVSLAYGYHKLGSLLCLRGDLPRARELLELALDRCRTLGERRGVAYALNGLGDLARTEGRLDEAGTRFADSLRLSREIGDQRGIADALRNLGWLACQAGRSDEAFVDLHEAMERFAAMEDRIGIAECLVGLAQVVAAETPARAARLLGAAESMRDAIGAPLPKELQPGVTGTLAQLREVLGETDLQGAMADGRAMAAGEAVGLARMMLGRLAAYVDRP
ncbi:MAG: tetratricopeptide repeat protein [Ardenticatenia bacterium]|nr:tetratricopeptide repeat protein [Ardenticatenia bacterium]